MPETGKMPVLRKSYGLRSAGWVTSGRDTDVLERVLWQLLQPGCSSLPVLIGPNRDHILDRGGTNRVWKTDSPRSSVPR